LVQLPSYHAVYEIRAVHVTSLVDSATGNDSFTAFDHQIVKKGTLQVILEKSSVVWQSVPEVGVIHGQAPREIGLAIAAKR